MLDTVLVTEVSILVMREDGVLVWGDPLGAAMGPVGRIVMEFNFVADVLSKIRGLEVHGKI